MKKYIAPYENDENYEKLLAYLAGFFDGEGCIYINKFWDKRLNRHEYALSIEVGNTNPVPLRMFQEIFGGDFRPRIKKQKHWKQAWAWRVKSEMAEIFLESLLPYLVLKEEEAILALEYRRTCVKNCGQRRTEEEIEQREKHYVELKALKRKEWVM